MKPKRYATAAAFRRALEARLQDIAGKESVDLQRLRRQVAFDLWCAKNSIQLPSDRYVGTCLLCFAWTRKPKKPARLAENTSQPDRPRAILTAHILILSEC